MFTFAKAVFANAFAKPTTRLFPAERRASFALTRDRLNIDIAKCTFCTLCSKRCPPGALAVDRAARTWTVDRTRCILCGFCAEVCPKDCLSFSGFGADAPTGEMVAPLPGPHDKA